MRGHEERAGKRLEEALEPDDRLDVQVVGRLVHQQHVRPAEQHAGHRHAHLPAARQRPHVAVDPLVVEAEAVEHLARLAFERVAAEMLVFLLHLAEAGDDRVHVADARRVGHRVLERLQLVVQVADSPAAGDRLVQRRATRHLLHVLPEVPDRQLLRHGDLALVRRLFTDDHPEHRGLAGAVRPDQAHLLARVELEGGVDEQHLPPVLLVHAGKGDHGEAISLARKSRLTADPAVLYQSWSDARSRRQHRGPPAPCRAASATRRLRLHRRRRRGRDHAEGELPGVRAGDVAPTVGRGHRRRATFGPRCSAPRSSCRSSWPPWAAAGCSFPVRKRRPHGSRARRARRMSSRPCPARDWRK